MMPGMIGAPPAAFFGELPSVDFKRELKRKPTNFKVAPFDLETNSTLP